MFPFFSSALNSAISSSTFSKTSFISDQSNPTSAAFSVTLCAFNNAGRCSGMSDRYPFLFLPFFSSLPSVVKHLLRSLPLFFRIHGDAVVSSFPLISPSHPLCQNLLFLLQA